MALKANQTPIETAKAFAVYINAGTRPYKAKAAGNKTMARVDIIFSEVNGHTAKSDSKD